MAGWLEQHREAIIAVLLTSLIFAIVLSVIHLVSGRLTPAPIVIQPISPVPTQTRAATATPGPIKVYVSGAVLHPGVYSVAQDSRLEQALAAAGGPSADADLVQINLAQRICDEQQIYVPAKGEKATPILPTLPARMGSLEAPSTSNRLININTAGVSELDSLPGIGPALAQRIVDYRQANGPFRTIEDIKKVKGIGDNIFAQIKWLITVE